MSCPVSVDEIESLLSDKNDESDKIELKKEFPRQASSLIILQSQ